MTEWLHADVGRGNRSRLHEDGASSKPLPYSTYGTPTLTTQRSPPSIKMFFTLSLSEPSAPSTLRLSLKLCFQLVTPPHLPSLAPVHYCRWWKLTLVIFLSGRPRRQRGAKEGTMLSSPSTPTAS